MPNILEQNKIFNLGESNEETFTYDFITLPWDDRNKYSKIGIITLLATIFLVIMALVTNCFIMQYDNSNAVRKVVQSPENDCNFKKAQDYKYIATIHSAGTQQLLCVGAVITHIAVLAHEDCAKLGPIRLRLGSGSKPSCRKGFAVDAIDKVYDMDGGLMQLVLLRTAEELNECSQIIRFGENLNWNARAYVIGRTRYSAKSFAKQYVKPIEKFWLLENVAACLRRESFQPYNTICVSIFGRCPIYAGDLLIQDNHLYGLSVTGSTYSARNMIVPFFNLTYFWCSLNKTLYHMYFK